MTKMFNVKFHSLAVKTIVPILCGVCVVFAGCEKNESSANNDKTQSAQNEEQIQKTEKTEGSETLLSITDENFYIGTWKAVFAYDANEDKMISKQEEGSEGYYITFAPGNILIADGENVMSAALDVSEGIKHTDSGDYLTAKYTDTNTNKNETLVLMLTEVKGEVEAGLKDGQYLTVMGDESGAQYTFFESIG